MAIFIPGLIAIIVFYLLILGVGLWAARKTGFTKANSNSDDVMLAGRNIGLFVGCFTMTATWVGGGFINGSSEIIVTSGLVWCQAPVGYGLALVIGGYFFAEKMRMRNYGTMLDPFTRKYGLLMGVALFIPALLGELFWSAAILSALGATLSVILELDRTISIIVSTAIALMYTVLGGLYSVAYTDVIQLVCIFIGLWVSVPFALTHDAVSSIVVSATSDNSTTSWLGEVRPTDIGIYMDTFLLLMFGGIPWQVYFQRVLSAKTVSIARTLSYVAGFGCMAMAVPAVLLGAVGANTDWNATTYGDGSAPTDNNLILPLVLRYLTPEAVAVIGLGAVSAAVMSSTDSSFLSASSMFSRNVFGVFYYMATKHRPSHNLTIWMMRLMQLIMAICACAMALSVTSIYYLFYLCSDLVFVILFPQLTCAIYMRDSNTYGSLAGFCLGLVFRLLSGEPGLNVSPVLKYPWYDQVAGQRFPFRTLCMIITMATIIMVSYAARFLFVKGILPKSVDIFGCFSGSSTCNYFSELQDVPVKEPYKANDNVEHAQHFDDLPPRYQQHVPDGIHVRKQAPTRGYDNSAFASKTVENGESEKGQSQTPSSLVTRL